MGGQVFRRISPVVLLAVAVTGCATREKQRIAILEQTNENLTARLNLTQSSLNTATRDWEELDQRLQAALDEVGVLHEQLAERPVQEEAAVGWTAVPGGAMIAIDESVLFAPGKATLQQEARRILDVIASAVQGQYADKAILVFGHTDDKPIRKSGWADNYQLSAERALAVIRDLRERGVSAARLAGCGCGEYRPRTVNDSETSRAANRRVEVFAIDSLSAIGQP